MNPEEFEDLVISAVETVPKVFKEKLDNIDIVVEVWPTPEQAKGRLLLGLYQGVPLTVRNRGYSLTPPDKITIFQGPIMLISRGDIEIINQVVKDTVEHEIAHHFGISDERLKEIKG